MKIAIIAQPEYFRFQYENDLDTLGDVKEFPFHFSMKEDEFGKLEHFNADINIFFRGEFVPNNVLKRLQGVKIAISSEPFPNYINKKLNYTFDSLNRFFVFENIRNLEYDYVFHYDKSSLKFLEEQKIFLSGEFILPVATNTYRKEELEKKWDLFFIGRSTEYRERFLSSLKHHNSVLHIAHGVFGEDLVKYCNQSKIVLNLHAENEVSWEPRIQMLLATGAFVLSHKITPNDYIVPNEDFIEISMKDPYDIYHKVQYYLSEDAERLRIAHHGYQKVQDYFESNKVFRELIEGILKGKYNKFRSTPQRARLTKLKFFAKVKEIIKKLGWIL